MSNGPVTEPLGLVRLLRRHTLLAALVVAYGAVAYWLSRLQEAPIHDERVGGVLKAVLMELPQLAFFVLFWRLIVLTYVQRDPDRMATLKSEVKGFLSDRERLIGGGIAMTLMSCTLIAFAQLKNLIPTLNPFGWDEYFMNLDRTLHFGVLPHVYLDAVLGWHYAISFFNGIYNIWLLLSYFVLVLACFLRPQNQVRMQYLIAFILTWAIGGNLLATVFSSAGPVYYANLGLGDSYAGLMKVLTDHADTGALTALKTQSLLWELQSGDRPLSMISAFPSMHVASSVLMAIFAFQHSRAMGVALSLFALCIMIGSVLLAWHYAVDGYAGALIAVACWYLAGWLVRLVHGAPAPQLVPSRA